ncbi:MAG: DUF87 domain-containing protein [Chitinophagaceae bacterium]|nr:MAG: DUF87 domain-containing protein [Chitinophagaceae bacterium]
MNTFQNKLFHIAGLELVREAAKMNLQLTNPVCHLNGEDGTAQKLNIPLDEKMLSRHMLYLGNIGTGKTNAISQMVQQVKSKMTSNDVMIIFDTKGDFYEQFYDPEKDLVIISGRNEDAVGKPLIYATSKSFMDYFGINTAEDLPRIKEVLADQLVEPTVIKDTIPEEENTPPAEDLQQPATENTAEETDEDALLSVTEDGELVGKTHDEGEEE